MALESIVRVFFSKPQSPLACLTIQDGLRIATGGVYTADEDGIYLNNNILLSVKSALQIAQSLDFYATNVGKHREMLISNPRWQRFYQVAQRNLPYVIGNQQQFKPVLTVPCVACGVCLPTSIIEVDHQRPQSGGEQHAVCKALRPLDLTIASPHGTKGLALQKDFRNPIGIKAAWGSTKKPVVKEPKGVAISRTSQLPVLKSGSDKAKRYTLNSTGSAFLSLFEKAGALPQLENACMNSFANLRPLCPTCNKAKSNTPMADDSDMVEKMDTE
jgi:hypothetical protein